MDADILNLINDIDKYSIEDKCIENPTKILVDIIDIQKMKQQNANILEKKYIQTYIYIRIK